MSLRTSSRIDRQETSPSDGSQIPERNGVLGTEKRVSGRVVGKPEVICLPRQEILGSRLVGSDLRVWHRLWTDDGQAGSYRFARRIEYRQMP